jgi:hypothetical protein
VAGMSTTRRFAHRMWQVVHPCLLRAFWWQGPQPYMYYDVVKHEQDVMLVSRRHLLQLLCQTLVLTVAAIIKIMMLQSLERSDGDVSYL